MSQEDSGVHSDGSYPTSERKHSTPVTAKELKVTWNYCFKDKNEDFLVEQEKSTEKERKGRRRSNHLCSNLGRRRSSNEGLRRRCKRDDGGVGRRNKDGRRGRRSKDESESHKVIPPLAWVKSFKARIVTNLYKIHIHQKFHIVKKITCRHELHHPFIPFLIISTGFRNHSSRNYGQPVRKLVVRSANTILGF